MNFSELIRIKHACQYRNPVEGMEAVPYTEHLYGVASIVSSVLDITGEITDESLRQDIFYAALGHDLLEDTDATDEEIVSASSSRTLAIIKELTNPADDSHTDEYMTQISSATEAARIVKYADLIENTMSVAYNLHILEKEWLGTIYLPILNKTTQVLQNTEFHKYPQTASLLRNMLLVNSNVLKDRYGQVFP